jgi:hypothetical protein
MRVHAGPRARLTPARALAGLAVPVALGVASAVLGWAAAAPIGAVRAPGPAPVDALVGLGAALACAGLLALAAVGATVTLAVAVTGQLVGRWADLAALLTPRVVRAAVGLVVGVTVVGGQGCLVSRSAHPAAFGDAATSAVAATAIASVHRPGRTLQLPPGWTPDRPAADPPDDQHHGQPTRQVHSLTSEPTARGPAHRPPPGRARHRARRCEPTRQRRRPSRRHPLGHRGPSPRAWRERRPGGRRVAALACGEPLHDRSRPKPHPPGTAPTQTGPAVPH